MKPFAKTRNAFRTNLSLIAFITLTVTAASSAFSSSRATFEPRTAAQESKQPELLELKPGPPLERELAAGGTHNYRINLVAGQYIHLVAEQLGVNVEVEVADPAGRSMAKLDWWWREGSEPLWVLTESTGNHTIKLSAPAHPVETGKYRIKIEKIAEWKDATQVDRDSVTAHKIFTEAEKLRLQGTAESQRGAMNKYQEALKLWRTLKDIDAEAQTLSLLGLVDYQLGNLKHAGEYLTPAIELFKSSGNRRGAVDAMNTLSVVYNFSGETQKALDNYHRALPLARAIKDHITEARILSGLGVVLPRLGQPAKALEPLNELLSLARSTANKRGEAMAHNNIGFVNLGQGQIRDAIEHYTQTLLLLREVGDRLNQATILNNIGSAYARMGEFQQGLDFLFQGLNVAQVAGDRRVEAMILGGIGHLYMKLGDYPKALQYCEQSLNLSRETGHRTVELGALSNLGTIHSATGEQQKSIQYFNQALEAHVKSGDRNSEAYVLTGLGAAYSRLDEAQKALEYYERALTIRRAVGDQYGESSTLSGLGAVHEQLGNHQKATDYTTQALTLTQAIGDLPGEISTLYQLSRFERSRNDLTTSKAHIQAAVAIVEATRTKVSFSDARANYFASRQELYDFYIDTLMQLHKSERAEKHLMDAFGANERRSARSLLDSLTEARADIRAGISSDLLDRERRLQQDLNAKADMQARLLSRKHTPEQANALAKEIETLTSHYDQVLTQIRQSSPRYATLTQPTPLTLKQIQTEVLDSDTLLLQYTLGEERSYLWAVTPTSIKSYELPKRSEIETAARRIYYLLVNKADALYPETVTSLSRMLLGPVADHLARKRLLIVSQGALQYVPFGALPEPGPQGSRRKQRASFQPLAVNHEIVNLPSASVIAVLRGELSNRKTAPNKVMVLADPVFGKEDQRVTSGSTSQQTAKGNGDAKKTTYSQTSDLQRSASDLNLTSFDRLPVSRSEAEVITAMVPQAQSRKALDFAASRATATSPALGQYQIVHFATHSLLNNHHPELSGIVLSLVDEHGQPQDGFLRLHEIYNLNLTADLVVLSACQTALGKEIKGEGMVGLTRGFMYAGTPRVVSSLWRVSDTATAELMKRFYQKMLGGGLRPAAALREAQISMLREKQWAAPYYWAGFVLQGEWR